jgi:hypothetical protein
MAWLCLLSTLLSAYGFATHQHSNSLEESQCTICVVAHSASPVAPSNLPRVVLVLVPLVVLAESLFAKQSFVPFALSVRPPPGV